MSRNRARWIWTACLVGLSAAVGPAEAAVPRAALETLRRIAVQDHGRVKPLDSFAWETLQRITGSPAYAAADPVDTILMMMAEPEAWQAKPVVEVPFGPLRERLGMGRRDRHISYSDLVASRKLMRMLPAIAEKQRRDEKLTMLEQETMDAFDRFALFSSVTEQKINLAPPASALDKAWLPVLEPAGYPADAQSAVRGAWAGLMGDLRAGRTDTLEPLARRLADRLRALNPAAYPASWRIELEVFYNHAHPFRAAHYLYFLAALALGLVLAGPKRPVVPRRVGQSAFAAAAVLHGTGIALRVILGGRPPVSNFYETTLWLPFVAVVLALILERIYRANFFSLAAALLAGITLTMSEHLPLDSSISPVVAVLRSNLWLTIHVLTIVASYGALALATMLAHVYGALFLRHRRHPALEPLDLFLYRTMQVGVVLLAAGIMLGAVWANASWGRYWGWDPKETWALITLLWFLALLHGRSAGWLHGVGVALATVGGFLLLLMTYYGVSFYLVGLHSYAGGNAKPIPPLLIGYLIAEAAFMLAIGLAAMRRSEEHT